MGQVKVILSEEVIGLGNAGEVVGVKPGYARNFLLPKGKAVVATKGQVNQIEHQRRIIEEKQAKEMKDLEAVKKRLEAVSLEFSAQAGEEGKLFGSVTAQNLADQLAEKGFEIDRRKISLEDAIRTLGEHTVTVRLRGDLAAEIKVTVEASE
ncbi:MAG: 50S ribosomal protein L9 [Deltaproteobacteria bacterium]|nr:50S ribosomal protein L9 [Deltaproteobacteria bacterium]